MAETQARVELLAHTPDPLAVIYAAFRQCYHAGEVADMWPRLLSGEISREKQAAFVAGIMASGHASPIEHVSFTFAISGVSRSLTHQLVRHRIASYSQQSQRYVDASSMEYIIPPAVAAHPHIRARFEAFMEEAVEAYRDIKNMLEAEGRAGSSCEDARFVLPNAAATNIVVTMNCRTLLNFFEERCCTRAQWEIRGVARQMLSLCRDVLPEVFARAGARCERLGYCPEGEKFTCGRYPLPEKR